MALRPPPDRLPEAVTMTALLASRVRVLCCNDVGGQPYCG